MLRAFSAYLRLFYLTVFRSKGTHARFTARRFVVMSIALPVIFFGQLVHWIGFLLDDIFFRGYRKIDIVDPVFIVGIPRSGTTLLHRVMAMDTDRFTSLRLWEILVAPSITERTLWTALGRIDRVFGGLCRRAVAAADRRIFTGLSQIHKMSLFDYDEDDMLLAPICATVFLFFPFPFRDELWRYSHFDNDTSAEDKARIMRFYKGCVRRHLYFHGPEKRFLSKNPVFSAKVDAIRNHFPGARVVCNMRSPYHTIPSLLSALFIVWDAFDNDPKGDVFRDSVLELAAHWYRHPLHCAPEWPEDRFAFLTYDVLTADLEAAVKNLYDRFGFEVGPGFAGRLRLEHEKARGYRSTHHYSIEKYGLTTQDVLADFADVFQRFGFDTADPGGA